MPQTTQPAWVPVDLVLMCVKLYHLDDAMEVASPLVGPNTTIMGFQNGVTAEDRLIQRFGAERVVGVGASAGQVPLAIGELPRGTSARTAEIVHVFKKAGGANVVEHDNVMEAIWGKFVMVCGGAVSALARLSFGDLVKVPELRQLVSMAVTEAIALANAKGVSFEQEYIDKADNVLVDIAKSNPAWRPSLLQDLDAGRPLELDAWSGGAVMIGKELSIPTPVNFAIYAGLKPYENGWIGRKPKVVVRINMGALDRARPNVVVPEPEAPRMWMRWIIVVWFMGIVYEFFNLSRSDGFHFQCGKASSNVSYTASP